jgi:glycine oxidase
MSEHVDVLIVGGGVIGLTTAYFLASEGVSVGVVDRGDFGQQASWAGAGIIPPGDPARARTPYDLLRAHSAVMYPQLSRRLREQTGTDNGYVVCGGVELPEPGDASPLPAEEWRGEGIAFRELHPAELQALVPGLPSSVSRAIYFPGMAQVRNPRHLRALQAACAALGAQLLPSCPVLSWVRTGGRIEGVETEHGRLTADRFVLATGAWADELLEQVGWRPGVHPVRGQIALLNTGRAGTFPILLQGRRYLVTRPDGRVLVGSTEESAGFDARPTAEGIQGLLQFAAQLLPNLAGAALERCWAGLRPGSPDGLPYLGPVPGCDNLFVAAGHFRSGIQLSPASARSLTDLLLGRQPLVPLAAFRLDRPPVVPGQTAFRS